MRLARMRYGAEVGRRAELAKMRNRLVRALAVDSISGSGSSFQQSSVLAGLAKVYLDSVHFIVSESSTVAQQGQERGRQRRVAVLALDPLSANPAGCRK
jgi:hypothetical protein